MPNGFVPGQRPAAPWSDHHWWGIWTTATSLPNTATSDSTGYGADLQEGDLAWCADVKELFVCTDPTPGAAVWVAIGSGTGSIGSGKYTPTITVEDGPATNQTAFGEWFWTLIGDVMTVSGRLSFDTNITAGADLILAVSLPAGFQITPDPIFEHPPTGTTTGIVQFNLTPSPLGYAVAKREHRQHQASAHHRRSSKRQRRQPFDPDVDHDAGHDGLRLDALPWRT